MLNHQPNHLDQGAGFHKLLQTSSRKIKAIGAGLQVFLKAIEKITFAPEPVHVPDEELINTVVMLLLTGDNPKRVD